MKTDTILNKENIIKLTDSQTLLNYYLQPFHNKGQLKQGQLISNPFLADKQKTPSFNIYKSSSGIWRFKDFADDSCDGTVFDLIMRLNGCNFPEALQQINLDFNLELGSSLGKKPPALEFHSSWNEKNAAYWKSYGILPAHLKHFRVFSVSKVTRYKENKEAFHIHSTMHNPTFAYQVANDCYKLYQPFSKKFKFSWIGDKPEYYTFGFSQLPKSGKQLFITGGEKDVMSLSAKGYYAICFNSETSLPYAGLIRELKERFARIIVLYDMDKIGIAQSKKIADKFQLHRAILPQLFAKEGKDISDFFKLGNTFSNDSIQIFPPSEKKKKVASKHLSQLQELQLQLRKAIASEIKEIPSLITYQEEGVVFLQSVHVIQGKSGTHKSRLAQTLCSVLLKKEGCYNELLGFDRNPDIACHVCYIDTERNLAYQFPKALQQIQLDAGYSIMEKPANFSYTSLVNISRAERFKALCEFIDDVQTELEDTQHLIVVLDVVSDCVMDFNNTQDSLLFIDMINAHINQKLVTFIAVIHENPTSVERKPRGHLGSEIQNKSTFTFRTAFENEKQPEPSDMIILHFPKNRNGKRPLPATMEFCEETKRLILADCQQTKQMQYVQNKKGNLGEIIEFLSSYITGVVSGKVLIAELCSSFSCGSRTIRERLKELSENYYEILDANSTPCSLTKTQKGREVFYSLQQIKNPTSKMVSS
ncbi:toprim domain-containing protein [Aquimarina sp. I32.4]|uniref:toprim domain-containing protein n=1 Tax=Aquimarina sp. I32.4 TaxID=2053903 RepID=UPI000CDEAC60|nr:toprim domain-containing protein [Aquimarina sp. I32.4]